MYLVAKRKEAFGTEFEIVSRHTSKEVAEKKADIFEGDHRVLDTSLFPKGSFPSAWRVGDNATLQEVRQAEI